MANRATAARSSRAASPTQAKGAKPNGHAQPPAPIGHNLADQDEQALLIHHLDKIRKQLSVVTEKKQELDVEREALNSLFALAKADKFSRKELTGLLNDLTSKTRDVRREEERRSKLRAWVGLPTGSQADLFDTAKTPTDAKDEIDHEADGYNAGLRGQQGKPPNEVPPRFNQAWLKGWGKGQETLALGLQMASKLKSARPAPEPEPDKPDVEDMSETELKAEEARVKDALANLGAEEGALG